MRSKTKQIDAFVVLGGLRVFAVKKGVVLMNKQSQLLPVSVAVLMGGESKRFGSPKAFLPYNGTSLAAHVLGQAALYSQEVFAVSRNPEQVPPDARKAYPVVMDIWKDEGPLSGLHAALSHSSQGALYLSGVDMPFLKGQVLAGFWNWFKAEERPDVVVPRIGGRWEPLCALWDRKVLSALQPGRWDSFQRFLDNGGLNIHEVSEKELNELDPSLDCLRNFNTLDEWKEGVPPQSTR